MELREGRIRKDRTQGMRNPEVRTKETDSRESGHTRVEQPGGRIRFGDGAGVQECTEMDYWRLRNLSEELFNTWTDREVTAWWGLGGKSEPTAFGGCQQVYSENLQLGSLVPQEEAGKVIGNRLWLPRA